MIMPVSAEQTLRIFDLTSIWGAGNTYSWGDMGGRGIQPTETSFSTSEALSKNTKVL